MALKKFEARVSLFKRARVIPLKQPYYYPQSSHQCHRITEVVMSLPPWSFCRLLYHWLWHPN